MTSRSRLLAKLIDSSGDVRSEALDNVSIDDEVVQVAISSDSTSAFVADSILASSIKAVTFQVAAFTGSDYQFTTVSAVMNNLNNDCDYTEYGTMESSELATYNVQVIGEYMELIANPVSAGISFKLTRIAVEN